MKNLYLAGLVMAFFVAPSVVLAQGVDIPAIVLTDSDKESWAIADYAHQFKTDLDSTGKVTRDAVSASLGRRFELSDSIKLVFNFQYQGNYYDFQKTGGVYQWQDIHEINILPLIGYKLNERWSLFAAPLFSFAGEGGADIDDSITAGGLGGFNYRRSDTFQIGLFLGASSDLEDDPAILLIPQLDWRFADDWKLHVGVTRMGDMGIGAELSYDINEYWQVATGSSFQRRRFRMDSRSGDPSTKGIGEDRTNPIYARLRWAPKKDMAFDVFGGVSVANRVRAERKGGAKLAKTDYDPAAILGLKGSLLF